MPENINEATILVQINLLCFLSLVITDLMNKSDNQFTKLLRRRLNCDQIFFAKQRSCISFYSLFLNNAITFAFRASLTPTLRFAG
jgi:hypothetical protein